MNSRVSYMIALDGISIRFEFESAEIGDLLHFLFRDIQTTAEKRIPVARYVFDRDDKLWRMQRDDGEFSMHHNDPVELALPLLNNIMGQFSSHNPGSVALHSALVSDEEGAILIPGAPGTGKSMACLWMIHLGLHYHTDEMVMIDRDDLSMQALTRPFTLRRAGMDIFRKQASMETSTELEQSEIRYSEFNGWVAHRAINPRYRPDIPPLKSILFPVYTTGDRCQITEISRAHAGMELMRSHFESQRLDDHGFATISRLVRDTPVYLMVYNDFAQLETLTEALIQSD